MKEPDAVTLHLRIRAGAARKHCPCRDRPLGYRCALVERSGDDFRFIAQPHNCVDERLEFGAGVDRRHQVCASQDAACVARLVVAVSTTACFKQPRQAVGWGISMIHGFGIRTEWCAVTTSEFLNSIPVWQKPCFKIMQGNVRHQLLPYLLSGIIDMFTIIGHLRKPFL